MGRNLIGVAALVATTAEFNLPPLNESGLLVNVAVSFLRVLQIYNILVSSVATYRSSFFLNLI